MIFHWLQYLWIFIKVNSFVKFTDTVIAKTFLSAFSFFLLGGRVQILENITNQF